MLLEILNYIISENSVVMIHILNLLVLVILIILFVSARKTWRKWTRVNDYLGTVTKTVNSVRYGDLSKKIEKMDLPNSEQLSDSINKMLETLSDREQIIAEYQNELQHQNKFLEAILNSLSDGLIIIDNDYKILRATEKISEWFDIDGKKLINTKLTNYIECKKNTSLKELKDEDIFVKANISSNFIGNSMELKLEDKKRRYIIILKNITDQKEIENLREDFIATLTHDLKVPIIAETNMLELFLNENFGAISKKQEIALKNMQLSNKELLNLVQIVLDTYKMRDGKLRLYKENVLLKNFITEIIDEMKPISSKTNNEIIFEQEREIRVYADKIQLKRVLKNFIHNAISYGKKNSPIEIKIGEIPKYITIKIKDYGAGIPEKDIDKIFDKYYSAANKFRKIGTGLGLYLAHQIIKAHNGEVSVESSIGEYTEFTIKIPANVNINVHYGE